MDIQENEVLESAIHDAFDLSARERVLLKERVLTDFYGEKRTLEPFYFILVDNRLYLVPVKSLQISLETSLTKQPPRQIVMNHVAHLDIIKSLKIDTKPPKLFLPLVEKILTLIIEIYTPDGNYKKDAVWTAQAQGQDTQQEADLSLDLSGLATDRAPAAQDHVDGAIPAPTPNAVAPKSVAIETEPPRSNATKAGGCCGRGARRGRSGNVPVSAAPAPVSAKQPAERQGSAIKIYLNYFRKTRPEADWPFQQLRDAWSKQMLKKTLQCDSNYVLLTSRRGSARLTEVDYRVLFDGLVADLENACGDYPRLSDLLSELFVALKRYFIVKKLFWETPRPFELLTVTIETVAKTQAKFSGLGEGYCFTEVEKLQHGCQMMVMLHALQALNGSFEDTEALASRSRSIHQSEGRLIHSLVNCLTVKITVIDGRHTWGDDGPDDLDELTDQVLTYRALLLERARTFYHLLGGCSSYLTRHDELSATQLIAKASAPDNQSGFVTLVSSCLRHCARHFEFYGRRRAGAPLTELRPETAVQLFEALDAVRQILLASNLAWKGVKSSSDLLMEVRHYLNRGRVDNCLQHRLPLRDAFLVLADELQKILQLPMVEAKESVAPMNATGSRVGISAQ